MKTYHALTAALLATVSVASAQTPQQSNAKPTVMDRVDTAIGKVTGNPLAQADTDMKHVLDAFASMDPKPIEKLSATEARQQPTASDGAMQVLREQGNSTVPEPSVSAMNIVVDGGMAGIPATVYKPVGASGPLPVVVYFHGGGFVIANNAVYDASSRTLAKMVPAVVVAVEYSKGPEHKFPAAHDDAVAAYKWVLKNAASLGGDPAKVAVAGESAGGNLAVNVAIAARDQKLQAPKRVISIYPVAGVDINTQSYQDNADAKPLNKPMMEWFFKNYTNPQDASDPRLDLVGKANLQGLPPTTVITDQIDPLRSEGQALAAKLKQAGVTVNAKDYEGVTHEFFGMGMVVAKAKDAEDVVVKDLTASFAGTM